MLTSLFLAGVTIVLPPEAGARGTEIELGEIATITGADIQTLTTLENLRVSSAPTPGYRRPIDRGDVLRAVRNAIPGIEVAFEGRSVVSVFPETVVLDAATIVAAVEQRLAAAKGNRDISWNVNRVINSLEVPRDDQGDGMPKLDVQLPPGELGSGLLPVVVHVRIGGVSYRRIQAEWRVAVWEEMPVLIQDVPAGASVTPAMFHLQRVERPSEAAHVLQPASTVGSIAKRNLTAGSVVVEADVTRPKVVKVNDQLTLLAKKGSIQVKVQVVSLQTAGIGDFIRVRRLDQNTELKAQVVSSDLVVLDLDA